MSKYKSVHDSIRKSDYQEAYKVALEIEREFGSIEISFFKARFLSAVSSFLFLLFGMRGLRLSKFLVKTTVSGKNLDWNHASAVLWGVYWQDMRKAAKYNLFVMANAKNEVDYLTSAAFVFYTDSFFGNLISLAAMKKLVTNEFLSSTTFKQTNLLVWLGVANQMNAKVNPCLKYHKMYLEKNKLDPFQTLISKASVLNMSISELSPIEAAVALEDCFRIACSLDNSRNHIQLYGVKSILLSLDGEIDSSNLFLEKAHKAARHNNNTLDWIIFARLACVQSIVSKNWTDFYFWHSEMKKNLNLYGPVSWYRHECKRLEAVAASVGGKHSSYRVLKILAYGAVTIHPVFFKKSIVSIFEYLFVGNIQYWKTQDLLKYYTGKNLKPSNSNEEFKSIFLKIGSLLNGDLGSSLNKSIESACQSIGAQKIFIENDIRTVIKKASAELHFEPSKNLTNDRNNTLRYFIDNKGFFIARTIDPNIEGMNTFSVGMLFQILDVHTIESYDLIATFLIQYFVALEGVKNNAELVAKTKVLTEKAELAAQVSHDIRSPLSALNLISSILTEVSAEKRDIIRMASQRINDIANQLLSTSKIISNGTNSDLSMKTELISFVVDSIVSEKRTQYRDRFDVSIVTELDQSYGLFSKINQTELMRALSNLINNSVESLNSASGKIVVKVRSLEGFIAIEIKDNGIGIPAHVIEKLKSGEVVSFGKDSIGSGFGLGLKHTYSTMKSLGGNVLIESVVGIGTTVTLSLPIAESPEWFASEILLNQIISVVCLDDEVSFHKIWDDRFRKLKTGSESLKLISLSNESGLVAFLESNILLSGKTFFLVDYELLGQQLSGLDLLEKYNLIKNSILVTSRYDDLSIQRRCSELGIKIIPKNLAGLVPFKLYNKNDISHVEVM